MRSSTIRCGTPCDGELLRWTVKQHGISRLMGGPGIDPTRSRGWAIGRNPRHDWIGGVPTLWALDAGGGATAPAKLGRYSTIPFLLEQYLFYLSSWSSTSFESTAEHPQRLALYRTRSLQITGHARGNRIADEIHGLRERPWKASDRTDEGDQAAPCPIALLLGLKTTSPPEDQSRTALLPRRAALPGAKIQTPGRSPHGEDDGHNVDEIGNDIAVDGDDSSSRTFRSRGALLRLIVAWYVQESPRPD